MFLRFFCFRDGEILQIRKDKVETMTPKRQLIDIFTGYKAAYETMQREKQQIDSDPYTTPAGKETRMQELFNRYKATVQGYHDKAAEAVNNGIAGLNEKWVSTLKGKITDAGYQIGLQNVLVMIENKAISRPEDMQAVVETYKGDYTALALIRHRLLKSDDTNIRAYASEIPSSNRSRNISLLEQLKANIDKYITINAVQAASKSWNVFNQGLTDVSASMDSMTQFLQTKLNDDLSLAE